MPDCVRGPIRRSRPRPFVPVLLALLALPPLAAAQEDFDRGQALYENHCGECHASTVHEREERRVDTREELYGWVAAWSVHAGLDWRAEEIESVTSYLSRRLYRFTR